jgi:hypothetical protein
MLFRRALLELNNQNFGILQGHARGAGHHKTVIIHLDSSS